MRLYLHPAEAPWQRDVYDGPALRTFPWVRMYFMPFNIPYTLTLEERC